MKSRPVGSAAFFFIVACGGTDPTTAPTGPGRWESLAPAPTARSEAAVAHADGIIATVGGFSDAVERYHIEEDSWSTGSPFLAEVNHATAVTIPGQPEIFIAGWQGSQSGKVVTYHPGEDRYGSRSSLPKAVGAAALVRVDQRAYLIGGSEGGGSTQLFIYHFDTDQWRSGPPMKVPRHHLAAAEVGGKIYAIGGRNEDNFTLDTVEVFDLSEETWSPGPSIQVGRSGHAAAAARGRIYVFGGEGSDYDGGVFPEVEELNPTSGTWRFVARMKTPRHGMMAIPIDDRIYVPIGADKLGGFNVTVNEVFFLP